MMYFGFIFLMLTAISIDMYATKPTRNNLINSISTCFVSVTCFILEVTN